MRAKRARLPQVVGKRIRTLNDRLDVKPRMGSEMVGQLAMLFVNRFRKTCVTRGIGSTTGGRRNAGEEGRGGGLVVKRELEVLVLVVGQVLEWFPATCASCERGRVMLSCAARRSRSTSGLGSESSQSRVRGLAARLSKSPPAAFLTSTSKKIRGQNLRRAASTVDFLVIRRPPSPRPTMGRGCKVERTGRGGPSEMSMSTG